MSLLLLSLVACGDPAVVDSAEPLVPGPYIYEEDDPPAPSLSMSQVEDAITEAVVGAYELDAGPIIEGYAASMVGQEEGCPDYYSDGGNTYWYDYCYAADGSYFSGYGFIYDYEEFDAGDGYIYNGRQIFTVADLVNGEGSAFSGSGSASDLTLRYAADDNVPHTIIYSIINGSFSYDGPEAAGTWLDMGMAPDLTMMAYDVSQEDSEYWYGHYIGIEGGVSGLGGDGEVTVVLDSVAFFDETMGSTCTLEPSGIISVRDPSGNWYDVLFDGPEEIGAASDASACDGCGEVYYRGEHLGQACADFQPLLEWEESPW